jgi:L-ascorbate metabolism protein UlaG (beta-lactamase superfamily)
MKISWMGHASFLIETAAGTKIITDPYESGGYAGAVGYLPANIEVDIVTVSHQHADHNYTQGLGCPRIVDRPGRFTIKDVKIEGILSYHDKEKGLLRGQNIIFVFEIENLKIAHFGDLGTEDIDIERFKGIDIVFMPIGGTFTVDAGEAAAIINKINPKIAIPMHFKTPKLKFDIDTAEGFLSGEDYESRDLLEVNRNNLDSFKKIVILKHQR